MDEYNFGGMYLERREPTEEEDEEDVLTEEGANGGISHVVPSVISSWSIRNYLPSEIAQEYFRIIIGKFSKDVLRKQEKLRVEGSELMLSAETAESILQYKRKLVSKHFASYLTRAVGEITKDGGGPESFPRLPGSHLKFTNPALEFVKSVIAVLELDGDVQNEVHALKRSLLAQIGVAEYSGAAKWENPCAKFILPDVFCTECNESRDVNLCDLPPTDEDASAKVRLSPINMLRPIHVLYLTLAIVRSAETLGL
jgi:DNA polymerase epsilon subunit 1